MNRPPEKEQLLTDVLADAAPVDFREALLNETLHLVRRRRRWRQTRRTAGTLAVLALLAVLFWQNLPQHPAAQSPMTKAGNESYKLVRTQSLPVGAKVTTRPLAAEQLIASTANVDFIQTTMSSGFRVINDEELLALLSPRPAVLIRLGPNSEQLILVNPEDEKGFPLN
jgi:hypothetical protein